MAPGLILGTPFHETFSTEEGRQAAIATTPLKRGGVSDDVAGAVLFLVSDLAGFVTGEVTNVNGRGMVQIKNHAHRVELFILRIVRNF